jgi:hypothetical protein
LTADRALLGNIHEGQYCKGNTASVQLWPFTLMSLRLLECRKAFATGLKAWITECLSAHSDTFLCNSAIDMDCFEARCYVPDVFEGNACEVATPARSNRDSTEECSDAVAQSFPHVETFVGEFPHTVHAVCVVWLTDDIFKSNGEVVVDVIWIPVAQIGIFCPRFSWSRHFGVV